MQMQLTCTCVWPTMHAFVAPSAQTDGMASPVPASEPHMLQWFHGKASRVSKRATWHVMVASLEVGATRLALPCHFMTAVMCLDRQPPSLTRCSPRAGPAQGCSPVDARGCRQPERNRQAAHGGQDRSGCQGRRAQGVCATTGSQPCTISLPTRISNQRPSHLLTHRTTLVRPLWLDHPDHVLAWHLDPKTLPFTDSLGMILLVCTRGAVPIRAWPREHVVKP